MWRLTSTNQPNPHEPYSLLLDVIIIIMIVIGVLLDLSSPTKIVYFSCVYFHWCESHGLLAIDSVGLLLKLKHIKNQIHITYLFCTLITRRYQPFMGKVWPGYMQSPQNRCAAPELMRAFALLYAAQNFNSK